MPLRRTGGQTFARSRGRPFVLMLALTAMGAAAQASEVVDVELLEFLGSWALEDEDWVAVTIEDLEQEQRGGGQDAGDKERAGADEDET